MLWNHFWSCIFTQPWANIVISPHGAQLNEISTTLVQTNKCMVRQLVILSFGSQSTSSLWDWDLFIENIHCKCFDHKNSLQGPCNRDSAISSPHSFYGQKICSVPCENAWKYFNPLWFEFKNTKPKDCAKLTKGSETFLATDHSRNFPFLNFYNCLISIFLSMG
jgi:hypothetical protein